MKGVSTEEFKKTLPEPYKSSDIYACQTAIKLAQCLEVMQEICDLLKTICPQSVNNSVKNDADNSVIEGQITLSDVTEEVVEKPKRKRTKKSDKNEVI